MGLLSGAETKNKFEPFPVGAYSLEIKSTEYKETKAGNGHYLNLELTVIKGKAKGRKIWHTLNIENPNLTAQEISRNQAAQMILQIHGKKIDPANIKELQKLLKGGRIEAMVKIQESKGYAPKNVIHYLIMPKDQDGPNVDSSDKKSKKSKSSAPWDDDDSTAPDQEKKSKKDKKKKKKGKKSKE